MTTMRELPLPAPFSPAFALLSGPADEVRERMEASDIGELERIVGYYCWSMLKAA